MDRKLIGERTLVLAFKVLLSKWIKTIENASKRNGQRVDQYFIVLLLVSSNVWCG